MEKNKKCKNCIYFPCLKVQCSIGNKEGCDNFVSVIEKELKEIDKKREE